MTAAEALWMNGDLRHSPLMDAVRRFHAMASTRQLPYCVVGGMAVNRNDYVRTTAGINVLTNRDAWRRIIPLEGDISSDGPESCVDKATGIKIDVLFTDEDWGMVIPMPDASAVGEYDEELGARFIGLHALVQLKAAVYMEKLLEQGEDVASKDRSDVYELMSRNLAKFSKEVIEGYDPAVREHCMKAYDGAVRASRREKQKPRDIER
jgi:hypothetical protein